MTTPRVLQPSGGTLRQDSLSMPPPQYMTRRGATKARPSTRYAIGQLEDQVAFLQEHLELAVERAEQAEDLVRNCWWTDHPTELSDEQVAVLRWICR